MKPTRPAGWFLCVLALLMLPAIGRTQVECWAPREDQDSVRDPKWAPQLKAMLTAEAIIRKSAAFMNTPQPVRMRTTVAAGPFDLSGARLFVRAYPEKSTVGIQVWTGKCEIIPQAERIAASIGQVDVFFNYAVKEYFLREDVPRLTGQYGGFPEYSGWILMTKDGRLPWIAQTLADRLDQESVRREKALADWQTSRAQMKTQDPEAVRKTYEMLKKQDPPGAEKFLASAQKLAEDVRRWHENAPSTTARLEKQISELKRYRAQFTPQELRSPATWADPTGAGKKQLEVRIRELRTLSPDDQRQLDEWARESRTLTSQAQAATQRNNPQEAAALRARVLELATNARALRQAHLERTTPLVFEARAEYELTNLKPGNKDNAMAYKEDPEFPDRKDPNRIQMIAIYISTADRRMGRDVWMKQVKDTLDYQSIAALLR